MKAPRLSEVLLPLLAARGWAPWPVAPHSAEQWPVAPRTAAGPPRHSGTREPRPVRTPFDDVQ